MGLDVCDDGADWLPEAWPDDWLAVLESTKPAGEEALPAPFAASAPAPWAEDTPLPMVCPAAPSAFVAALPAALRAPFNAPRALLAVDEAAERAWPTAWPAAPVAASRIPEPSMPPVAAAPRLAAAFAAVWPAWLAFAAPVRLATPFALAWLFDGRTACVAVCVTVCVTACVVAAAFDAARWRRRSARRSAAWRLMSGRSRAPMPRAEPPIWPPSCPVMAGTWPPSLPARPPLPRTWACVGVIAAKARLPASRVRLSVVLRMEGPPAGGESAACRVHYAWAWAILPRRVGSVGKRSVSRRQQAVAAARAERMRLADQGLQHLGRGVRTGRSQQAIGQARHDRRGERGAAQHRAAVADHAGRAERHLLAAGRLGQHAVVRVDAADADHAGVGRGEQRRRRGSVVADRGDQHVAARDHRLHR